jgi:hypothetical protein
LGLYRASKTNRAKIDYEDHAVSQARLGDVHA